MQPKRLVALAGMLFVLCLANTFGTEIVYEQVALSETVELSDLIFAGQMVKTQFVYRESILGGFTTDIAVAVDQVLKGAPNAGKDRVKFMVLDGVRGEEGVIHTDQPKFEVGEKILLFLCQH